MGRRSSSGSGTGSLATKAWRWSAWAALFAALAWAPPPPATGVAFLVMGDWGKQGSPSQRAVAAQLAKTAASTHAAFIISTGDNFYPSGVKSDTDYQWKKTYEDVYTAPSLMVPWYVALGNHDYRGDPDAEVAYTGKSTRWKMPARYYTFTVAVDDTTNAEFFVLDTSPFVEKYKTEASYSAQVGPAAIGPQLHWLDSALSVSKAQWKIGVGHHTIYSASPTHGNTPELIKDVVPLFEKYHVQAYLNGHDHDLQDARAADVAYFTSGGGAEARPTGKDEHTKFSKQSTGFLAAVLDAHTLHVRFLNDSGRVLYSTEVHR